jgi:hypothetical protein
MTCAEDAIAPVKLLIDMLNTGYSIGGKDRAIQYK